MKKFFVIFTVIVAIALLVLLGSNYFKPTPGDTGTPIEPSSNLPVQPQQPAIDKDRALELVRMRTEVQKYNLDLTKLGSYAMIEVEDLGDDWNVHVFEIVDQGDDSHTATFGWYRVNKMTGKVTKDI